MTLARLLSAMTFCTSIAGSSYRAFKISSSCGITSIVVGCLVGYVFATVAYRSTDWMHKRFDIDAKSLTPAQKVSGGLWQLIGWCWAAFAAFAGFGLMHLIEHWINFK